MRTRMNIQYVNVDNPSILADLDTPEEYDACAPVIDFEILK